MDDVKVFGASVVVTDQMLDDAAFAIECDLRAMGLAPVERTESMSTYEWMDALREQRSGAQVAALGAALLRTLGDG